MWLGLLFAWDDCVAGANLCAGAALDAGFGVDNIDFAFGDSLNGAVGKAGATSYTLVGNYVSHCCVCFYE